MTPHDEDRFRVRLEHSSNRRALLCSTALAPRPDGRARFDAVARIDPLALVEAAYALETSEHD